ncbi:MAG: gephyrin-like molybdotransferase Glp [Rhodospirillaceae bacterium]|nr:gephyrin-like molybdotransferase Glp [Rhodospirillaceae bacterium]
MLSYDQALDVVLSRVRPLGDECRSLPDALGQVLAEDVTAAWDMPATDNSAMDGYAFQRAAYQDGGILPVLGSIRAGDAPVRGETGGAMRIMTGAPIPSGCDCVVPKEDVVEEENGIRLLKVGGVGANIRCRGEEFRRGEVLLKAGDVLRAGEIGLLAANGRAQVRVYRRPKVALLTTGDELVDLGTEPGPGQIVDSNHSLLSARLREEGCDVLSLGRAADETADLKGLLLRGLDADLLLTSGGVSVGDYDLVRESLDALGFASGFWKVAIKPGKPVLFGMVGEKPVFGLPGNPAASAVTFQLFVRPALRRLGGFSNPLEPRCRAILTERTRPTGNRQTFFWGRLYCAQGCYRFTPSHAQGAGQNRSIKAANALLSVAADSPALDAGQEVEVMVIYPPEMETVV